MGFLNFLRRKKSGYTAENRRELLLKHGRMADAFILDTEVDDNGDEIARYIYNIQGVDFESSEILTEEQRLDPLKYAPGASVTVRFDPRNHGNSVLM